MTDAYTAAVWSKVAYCEDFRKVQQVLTSGCIPAISTANVELVNVYEARCAFVCCEDKLYVAIAGTNDFADAFHDAMCVLTRLVLQGKECGRVHAGFLAYYLHLRKCIMDRVGAYVAKSELSVPEIIFVGHSLGSVACIAALDASFLWDGCKTLCWTFGAPKMGDTEFVRIIADNIQCTRVFMDGDIIPTLPSSKSYKHCGTDMRLRIGTGSKYAGIVNGKLAGLWRTYWNMISFSNHMIGTYIERLQKTQSFLA